VDSLTDRGGDDQLFDLPRPVGGCASVSGRSAVARRLLALERRHTLIATGKSRPKTEIQHIEVNCRKAVGQLLGCRSLQVSTSTNR